MEEKEELLKMITHMINATNNLMIAVLAEKEKDISYWNKSIKNWREYINIRVKRYSKTLIEEEVPF